MAQRRRRFIPRRDTTPKHRINGFIRAPKVRLVGDNLEEVSAEVGQKIESDVYNTGQLRRWADAVGMDLVEIAPKAVPPVVRICDYKKFLYQNKRREKEIKSKAAKQSMKEIRFGPETAEHDYEFKMRHGRTFLEEGSKVKAYVHFRGRSIVFKDRGELLLLRFMKDLEEVGAADQMPKMEGRRMIVILSPTKKAVTKQSDKFNPKNAKKVKKAAAKAAEGKKKPAKAKPTDAANPAEVTTTEAAQSAEVKSVDAAKPVDTKPVDAAKPADTTPPVEKVDTKPGEK